MATESLVASLLGSIRFGRVSFGADRLGCRGEVEFSSRAMQVLIMALLD